MNLKYDTDLKIVFDDTNIVVGMPERNIVAHMVKDDQADKIGLVLAASLDMLGALENALPWLIKAENDDAFKDCALPLGGKKAIERIQRVIAKAKGTA